jgi:hypothetical protein
MHYSPSLLSIHRAPDRCLRRHDPTSRLCCYGIEGIDGCLVQIFNIECLDFRKSRLNGSHFSAGGQQHGISLIISLVVQGEAK